PPRKARNRCGRCGRRCGRYDAGEGRRRWRGLDLGTVPVYLAAEAPRVRCAEHGVVVSAVPWARHGARFTRSFEDQAAWLATHTSRTTVSDLLRVAWRTVGGMITRVVSEAEASVDRLSGLRRIGIDEISYRKGHRYLTVVVDHDRTRLVWASAGRDEATLSLFFERLGPQRCGRIRLVSADAAPWIANVVKRYCPRARVCLDPFHVVSWATDALDQIRRQVWNAARRAGQSGLARELKGARFALWKNPENLTGRQETKLAFIARTNAPLYRAYLLKEQLRAVFRLRGVRGKRLLESWLKWARRCRLRPFVDLAKTITRHRVEIEATLQIGLSNALVESTNTKIRLITRQAFGFHSPQALIGLAMLALGGLCPALPGRA
ncbi:MAG: ISL3 family transposase, partial [bacterium]|nr:ISL3 family transposase [bacterium]